MDLIAAIAFHGSHYRGWQSQGGSVVGKTLEDTLIKALAGLPGAAERPAITAVSRLDAGVHAHSFLLRTRLAGPLDLNAAPALRSTLQGLLPPHSGIHVRALRVCRPSQIFLRKAVGAKQYSYYIRTGPYHAGLAEGLHEVTHYCKGPLDVRAMVSAASALVGTHDFTRFTSGLTSSHRRVSLLSFPDAAARLAHLTLGPPPDGMGRVVHPERVEGEGPFPGHGEPYVVRLKFVGDGFLRHQIRFMASAVMVVGEGRCTAERVAAALASSPTAAAVDGSAQPPFRPMPGRGLWLEKSLLRGRGVEAGVSDLDPHFWTDEDWCNNPSATYAKGFSIPDASYHPPQ